MDGGPSGTGIGQPVRRREDLRLLRGTGRYSDDVNLPRQAYAVLVRSPHAHARIRSIDTQAARAMPGVLAVLTADDLAADGINSIPHNPLPTRPPADILLTNRDGSAHGYAPQELLPTDRVRYVGDAVVIVVAETKGQARDAAEAVEITYKELKAVVDASRIVLDRFSEAASDRELWTTSPDRSRRFSPRRHNDARRRLRKEDRRDQEFAGLRAGVPTAGAADKGMSGC